MKILDVEWSEDTRCDYFVDKDQYSHAHEVGELIELRTFSGIYYFNKNTKCVSFDDGITVKMIFVKEWHLIDTLEMTKIMLNNHYGKQSSI